jgi:hypothetical protein
VATRKKIRYGKLNRGKEETQQKNESRQQEKLEQSTGRSNGVVVCSGTHRGGVGSS